MNEIRHVALILLVTVVLTQTCFVLRYGLSEGWHYDFVGRALFFKSTAVLYKAITELLLWTAVPELIALIPTWLLGLVVSSDVYLAIGCTVQYLALERQKREDRHEGTELGRDPERDHAPAD